MQGSMESKGMQPESMQRISGSTIQHSSCTAERAVSAGGRAGTWRARTLGSVVHLQALQHARHVPDPSQHARQRLHRVRRAHQRLDRVLSRHVDPACQLPCIVCVM